jgi:molybdate transport system substrate-binding protein
MAALAGVALAAEPADESPPVVAAASDLRFALEELAQAFTRETGLGVELAFGSSGNFARQIRQGAPFELFLSADEGYALELARDGLAQGDGALYALGRIALFVPMGSPLRADGTLADLRQALDDGRLGRFAIANPEHAPYGRRAEEALRHAGLWSAIEHKLVLGENVSQAAQFAASGATQGGIVAYSLALSPKLAALGTHALIPADWHEPLNQRMVLLANAGPVAERFYAFVQAPAARAVLRRQGFALPGEQS